MLFFTAEFPNNIKSLELYEKLKHYNLNVIDMIDSIYVYGKVYPLEIIDVIKICSDYSVKIFHITKKIR